MYPMYFKADIEQSRRLQTTFKKYIIVFLDVRKLTVENLDKKAIKRDKIEKGFKMLRKPQRFCSKLLKHQNNRFVASQINSSYLIDIFIIGSPPFNSGVIFYSIFPIQYTVITPAYCIRKHWPES